jgi:hypothetical protein
MGAMLRGGSVAGEGFLPLMLTGLGLLAGGVLQVPWWARLRGRQMEEVAERLTVSLISSPDNPPTDEPKRNPGSS